MKTEEAFKNNRRQPERSLAKMPGWSIGLPAKECKTGGEAPEGPRLSLL